jgi:hypothetical protein
MPEPLPADLPADEFWICEKHDRWCMLGYPCHSCQTDWEEAHPERHKAISDFAAGRISNAAVRRILARKDN